jgi:ribonuclease P protein component
LIEIAEECVNRKFRLTQAKDFLRVKNTSQSIHHRLLILAYAKNDLEYSRFAVVSSGKIGNAVIRNRVRRRIKSCVENYWNMIKPGWDLIFYSRIAVVDTDYTTLKHAINHLLEKADVL